MFFPLDELTTTFHRRELRLALSSFEIPGTDMLVGVVAAGISPGRRHSKVPGGDTSVREFVGRGVLCV